ncbi:MAG: hypothetical protein WKF79_06230 [Nocardioides sp.]
MYFVLSWANLDPKRFERAVQMLLKRLHPDLMSIDGAGGDDGRDAELPITSWSANDGIEAFEIKSHDGRLTSSPRRQIKRSLQTAVLKLPKMRKWTLIIGLNPTPGEITWFRTTLQAEAPGVDIRWEGIDWLDEQFAAHRDLTRYVEGHQAELLRAAGEYNHERAVLAGGATDLFMRQVALQARVDELSPHWTLDTATSADGPIFRLRAKHSDAATADPIVIRPRLNFSAGDAVAARAREEFERMISYGGVADLDPTHFKGFELDCSDEVRSLLAGLDQPGHIRVGAPPQRLDRPLRATLEVRDGGPTGKISNSLEVSFTEYTAGARGGRMIGSDAAGVIKVAIGLPRPEVSQETGPITGGEFNITFANPWDFPLADVVGPLKFQAELHAGGHLTIRASWAKLKAHHEKTDDAGAEQTAMLARAASVLARFEDLLDVRLRLPFNFMGHEVETAERALRALEGEHVPMPGAAVHIAVEPGVARQVLADLGDDPVRLAYEVSDHVLTIGDVEVPYGTCTMKMTEGRIVNRAELLGGPDDGTIQVHMEPTGEPIVFIAGPLTPDE